MAFDQALADRIRDGLEDLDGASDRKMFGGIIFMVHGNMAVGVMGDDLIVRLGEQAAEVALSEPGTRVFDITRRPMRNWVVVDGERLDDDALARWLRAGVAFASALPPK
ncbi:TfoX/Sxy family protein [Actinoplanes hulinensis]|uniref:TfoX/Sxy family protein n=2 Tax=Actinoplanes hulinensis TaxID=1144547 RepID=A0ABS7BCA6_9ACTN|nr:TfoX/Sxy family protein [Actinoplanes hulinensis]